jgi:hypothetical protein
MSRDDLSSEAKIDNAYRAATEDMTPTYVAVLRNLAPGMRAEQAFGLWRMARDALYRQEIAKGLAHEAAMRSAARRMLRMADDRPA